MGARELLIDRALAVGVRLSVAGGKLIATPLAALPDDLRAELRANRVELVAALSAASPTPSATTARTCSGCSNRRPKYGTCGEPIAAGLTRKFELAYPPEGFGATCPAFDGKAPVTVATRPYMLTREQGDACHAGSWDDSEIATFTARVLSFVRRGIRPTDADDLAERLILRDRGGDNRRLCLECSWLGDLGRCTAAASGRLPGTDSRFEPVQTVLHRCPAFGLRKGLQ